MEQWTCPSCGAGYLADVAVCPECNVALERPPEGAPLENDGDEIVYELDGWDPKRLDLLRRALELASIPSRWENDELVVRAGDEEAVDAIFDEYDRDWEELPPDTGTDVDEDEAESAEAMGDLWVAADRLAADPSDDGRVEDFAAVAEDVAELPPPFGIDPDLWARVQRLATALVERLETEVDGDALAADARALGDVLRPYV